MDGCTPPRRRVLTVGDGDLSYSLALARAFGDHIELTATTYLSVEELVSTYARAAENLAQLHSLANARLLHGVDACALHEHALLGTMDNVIFSHPHLGLADLLDVDAHARPVSYTHLTLPTICSV